jgi:ornithine carbamoyltransferase
LKRLRSKPIPGKCAESLAGKALAMVFEKPSLRTRVTFDVAMHQLGGYAIDLSPAEISLGKRESVEDVAHNLERMVQGIMVRTHRRRKAPADASSSRLTWSAHSCSRTQRRTLPNIA